MNHSFLDIDDLEKFTDLPVLASIPRIVTDDDLKKQKTKKRIVFAFSFAVILIVIAALIVHFFFYPLNTLVAEYFGITITY